jgi:hypothetical protein
MLPNRATLALLAIGFGVAACSQEPLPGDTDFESARRGFDRELTVDQRKSIKKMQTETAGSAAGS